MKKRILKREELRDIGSLITIDDNGVPQCLGNLLHFEGHGTYDPTFGQVPITKEEAQAHNDALDETLIKGLDENCEVGMYGSFYFGKHKVCTFTGKLVSDEVTVNGTSVTFRRKGKVFRGRLGKDRDYFRFKRVA